MADKTEPTEWSIERPCPMLDQSPDFADDSTEGLCEGCECVVYNLSAMPESDARALVDEKDEVCIRYEIAPTGGPVFKPRERSAPMTAALAGGLSLAFGVTAACGIDTPSAESTPKSSSGNTETTETAVQPHTDPSKADIGVGRLSRKPPTAQTPLETVEAKHAAGELTDAECADAKAKIAETKAETEFAEPAE